MSCSVLYCEKHVKASAKTSARFYFCSNVLSLAVLYFMIFFANCNRAYRSIYRPRQEKCVCRKN